MCAAIRHNSKTVSGHDQSDRIHDEDKRDFAQAVNLLNKVMARVREYIPEAEYYVECESLHLMTGLAHDAEDGGARTDRIALSAIIDNCDCGAW